MNSHIRWHFLPKFRFSKDQIPRTRIYLWCELVGQIVRIHRLQVYKRRRAKNLDYFYKLVDAVEAKSDSSGKPLKGLKQMLRVDVGHCCIAVVSSRV